MAMAVLGRVRPHASTPLLHHAPQPTISTPSASASPSSRRRSRPPPTSSSSMLREFDERGGWSRGFRSCAHWLNWRTGLDLGAAREKVRVARALAALPLLSAAMARGEVSFSKVRALTRVATPGERGGAARSSPRPAPPRTSRGSCGAGGASTGSRRSEQERRRHAGRYLRSTPTRTAWWSFAGAAHARGRRRAAEGARRRRSRSSTTAARGRAARRVNAAASAADRRAAAGRRARPGRRERARRRARSRARAATATRSSSTSTPRRCRRRATRAPPRSATARAFPRKRPAGWPATPPSW